MYFLHFTHAPFLTHTTHTQKSKEMIPILSYACDLELLVTISLQTGEANKARREMKESELGDRKDFDDYHRLDTAS